MSDNPKPPKGEALRRGTRKAVSALEVIEAPVTAETLEGPEGRDSTTTLPELPGS